MRRGRSWPSALLDAIKVNAGRANAGAGNAPDGKSEKNGARHGLDHIHDWLVGAMFDARGDDKFDGHGGFAPLLVGLICIVLVVLLSKIL